MNKAFFKASGIRILRTVIEVLTAQLIAYSTFSDIQWGPVLFTTLIAGLESFAMALNGLPEVELMQNNK